MTDAQRKLDPRYDPAFQPGYTGPVVSARRGPGSRVSVPAPDAVAPDAEGATVAQGAPGSSAERGAAAPEPVAADADAPAPARESLRELLRNPFLVALTVLGAVLLIAGIAWAERARQLVETRGVASTELDYWFLQTTVVGAPLTVIAGLGVLAGVLFSAARAWERLAR